MNNIVIDANFDSITCPACRVCIPQGGSCSCPMSTSGPSVENQIVKKLTEGSYDPRSC